MIRGFVQGITDYYKEKARTPNQAYYDELKEKKNRDNWLFGAAYLDNLVENANQEQLNVVEDYLYRMDQQWNLFDQHTEYIGTSKTILEKKLAYEEENEIDW